MDRRAFLATLAAGLAAALDPERLLWVPGRKLVSIPKPCTLNWGDVITIAGRYAVDPVTRESTGELQEFVVGRNGRQLFRRGSLFSYDTPELQRRYVSGRLSYSVPSLMELSGRATAGHS